MNDPAVSQEFGDVRAARGWVRAQLTHPARRHADAREGISDYRVSIVDTVEIAHLSPMVYDLTGSHTAVVAALADTVRSVISPDVVSGRRDLDAATVVPSLMRLYEQVTAEYLRAPADVELAAKRQLLREDLAMTVDGLDDLDRRAALNRVAMHDLVPLARPNGRFTATFEILEADAGILNRPMRGTRLKAVAQQRFDSASHAREYLRLVSETYPGEALVRARTTEAHADGAVTSFTSQVLTGARLARALSEVTEFDGTVITGLSGVDETRLAVLVGRYEEAARVSPSFEFVDDAGGAGLMRRRIVASAHSALGTELAYMLTDPGLAAALPATREALRRVDLGHRTHRNIATEVAAVASSGFVGAEVQVALIQHYDLHEDLHRRGNRLGAHDLADLHAKIGEVRDRVHTLLSHPALTATDRIDVLEELARAERSPLAGYEFVFDLPDAAALGTRAVQLMRRPPAVGPEVRGRDVDDLLRLYQLTQVVGDRARGPEQHTLRLLRFDLGRHLNGRIATHPGLLGSERTVLRSLMTSIGHDPRHELPTRRAEFIAEPVSAGDLLPVEAATVDNYRLSFDVPEQPGRRVVLGTENGRWVARNYIAYPGHPNWKLADGAATFADHHDMITALEAGVRHRDRYGTLKTMPPASVPAAVGQRLREVHRLHTEATGRASAPPAPPRPTAPPVTRTTRARQQAIGTPPVPPRRRGLG
ncbi:hypothetical protein ACTD5D_21615 [Nocardia takedensis]|uniref:hypothetical protein n=1 Tax=Nocardia takedensis TaxID=259390 RepID=UPI003F761F41